MSSVGSSEFLNSDVRPFRPDAVLQALGEARLKVIMDSARDSSESSLRKSLITFRVQDKERDLIDLTLEAVRKSDKSELARDAMLNYSVFLSLSQLMKEMMQQPGRFFQDGKFDMVRAAERFDTLTGGEVGLREFVEEKTAEPYMVPERK